MYHRINDKLADGTVLLLGILQLQFCSHPALREHWRGKAKMPMLTVNESANICSYTQRRQTLQQYISQ